MTVVHWLNNNIVNTVKGLIARDISLSDYTSLRVGGLAKILYKPYNLAELKWMLKFIPLDERLTWLGLGSNCLIRDSGISGTVIVTQGCLNAMSLLDAYSIRVEAGVSCATMARFSARNGLGGGEFLAGIPGTIGGALRMNAGCSGRETWELVRSVETIDRRGVVHQRTPAEFAVNYRCVSGLEDEWFVAGTFKLMPREKSASLEIINQLLNYRSLTQPINTYNCGSVFKNPAGTFAARIIENAGLKGCAIGGASVSEKHANFIINSGHATANDIELLIEFIRETVYQNTAITLEHEVHIIGEK